MKKLRLGIKGLILVLFFFIKPFGYSQVNHSIIVSDTIKVYKKSIYVHLESFEDGLLSEKTEALLYPIVHHNKRRRFLKKPIVEEVYMDSVVYHGDKKSYLEDRFYKVENYFHGVFKEVEYFNDQGKVISEKEFRSHDHRNTRGPDIQAVFLIKRSKKSKKKSKGKKE